MELYVAREIEADADWGINTSDNLDDRPAFMMPTEYVPSCVRRHADR